jgi:glycosyltransferase involved in cell wall biosynthesis
MTRRRFAIISRQAFSIANFRGPLIRDIVSAGYAVHAIAPDFDEETRRAVTELGAHPVDCGMSRTGLNIAADILLVLRLTWLMRQLEAEAVLSYFAKPVIYGTMAAWIAGVPRRYALIAGLGFVFVKGKKDGVARRLLRRAVSTLYWCALKRAHVVFFQNQHDMEEFVDAGLIERERAVNTLGTGVDLAEWQAVRPILEPITFLLAARLLREKGIREFAEAARSIRTCHPTTRFVLLGQLDTNPGGLKRSEIERWVAEGVLEWHGHVTVAPWLEQTSVYVLPSYYREGVPRSIQEAMAMARPIVTTDVVGCRETVVEGVNGFMVPPHNVAELITALKRFIEEPSLIKTMGAASRRLVEKRFDVRRVNATMLDAMQVSKVGMASSTKLQRNAASRSPK